MLRSDACWVASSSAQTHDEEPVTQKLDNAAMALLEHFAQKCHQLTDESRRWRITQALIQAGAADKISKNNSGHGK